MFTIDGVDVLRRCDDCSDEKRMRSTPSLLRRLEAQSHHRCRSCHARSVAKQGGLANVLSHSSEHFAELGRKLAAFNSDHPENLRKGGLAAASLGIPSKAGKIGGRRNADKGNLRSAGKAAHTPAAELKRFETKKRTGKLTSSNAELLCLKVLRSTFSSVVHHVLVDSKFHVDFYVQDLDVYVQFDGAYWHGLQRPYDELDACQRHKYDTDRALDECMALSRRRLVRITDEQFSVWSPENVIKHVRCNNNARPESVGARSA